MHIQEIGYSSVDKYPFDGLNSSYHGYQPFATKQDVINEFLRVSSIQKFQTMNLKNLSYEDTLEIEKIVSGL